ncbi:hypothetical protein Bca52824_055081 [Brassica carinata]|uniref:Uncharacterized protein n=1 Tax=Brassica carinata TaxID=52824 RepID=A0A8X7UNB3_BRACI|nr:hypothetical protein Bca52824_055081 [Brassica carinata]
MMRFTIIVVAFLSIIQTLEDHILVYAHEGGDADHKSLYYRGDEDSSTLHPKDSHDFTNTGAPRKLRPGRTMSTTVVIAKKEKVRATNNDDLSIKISPGASKQLMVERKLGFHKRSKSSSFKWKPKKKKPSGRFVAFYDDYRGPAREHKKTNILADLGTTKHIDDLTNGNSLPKRELFSSAKDMNKLARLLRSDYPIHSKPRGKPPVHNRAPDKI